VKEKGQSGDLSVECRIILECILKKEDRRGVNWTELAQDRDQWRARVNTLMNFRVP
jgi:hypothetical protein